MGESENGKSSEQRAREKARNFVANESVSIALKKSASSIHIPPLPGSDHNITINGAWHDKQKWKSLKKNMKSQPNDVNYAIFLQQFSSSFPSIWKDLS